MSYVQPGNLLHHLQNQITALHQRTESIKQALSNPRKAKFNGAVDEIDQELEHANFYLDQVEEKTRMLQMKLDQAARVALKHTNQFRPPVIQQQDDPEMMIDIVLQDIFNATTGIEQLEQELKR